MWVIFKHFPHFGSFHWENKTHGNVNFPLPLFIMTMRGGWVDPFSKKKKYWGGVKFKGSEVLILPNTTNKQIRNGQFTFPLGIV